MYDSWNTEDVKWSNENIESELAKVEKAGQQMADTFLRNKIMFLFVVIIVLGTCILYLDPILAIAVELVVLLVTTNYLKKAGRKAQAPIYQMCDPYLQFAYIRAYARKPFARGKTAARRQILSLAQCMVMAGEGQAALAIQSLIKEPEKLRIAERSIYYNTQILAYNIFGWTDRIDETVARLKRMRENSGRMEKAHLDALLRMDELKRRREMGDIAFVEDYFKKYPPVYRFQEVGMHHSLGMMYMKAGDAEKAREHVQFVLDKGNKLYYKKNMEDYLRSSLEPSANATVKEKQQES